MNNNVLSDKEILLIKNLVISESTFQKSYVVVSLVLIGMFLFFFFISKNIFEPELAILLSNIKNYDPSIKSAFQSCIELNKKFYSYPVLFFFATSVSLSLTNIISNLIKVKKYRKILEYIDNIENSV